ncbi:hypothetical protein FGG08_004881 [Glutinoglossum americanum]|uniref:Uncharacterized protein n=1 Tax=Glutinoglossum americanum TaxID=1670608 RepID=A0A9P8HVL8_9PEZI|nr:hypothetical protein FGG08_004881 [Glutinoglossum americanum]
MAQPNFAIVSQLSEQLPPCEDLPAVNGVVAILERLREIMTSIAAPTNSITNEVEGLRLEIRARDVNPFTRLQKSRVSSRIQAPDPLVSPMDGTAIPIPDFPAPVTALSPLSVLG